MNKLEFVKADVIRPIIDRLETHGSNSYTLMEQAGLSPIVYEQPGHLVPQFAAWKFATITARHSGSEDFVYECVASPVNRSTREVASLQISNDQTAFKALEGFVRVMDKATSGTRFWLASHGREYWILRKSVLEHGESEWQVELFAIAAVVKALSNILGRNWRPRKVAIRQRSVPKILPKGFSATQIFAQSDATGVSIDIQDLVNADNFSALSSSPQPQYPKRDVSNSAENSLRDLIIPYALNWNCKIDTVAEAFGISVRTFQRVLAKDGLKYSELLDDARHRLAVGLLQDQATSITEVALALGYPYPNHFSRAFKRRAGVAPKAYQMMVQNT